MEPYNNFWAIPGDLVYPDEDLDEAANRILKDLTGLSDVGLHQAQSFGHPKRHPQGRVVTVSYFAMVRIEDFNAKASSWADEISWVPIHDIPVLAFDHNLIMATTIELLKQKLRVEPICFDMLPDRFTLSDFQKRTSIIQCSALGASMLAGIAQELAGHEFLQAHAESAAYRK